MLSNLSYLNKQSRQTILVLLIIIMVALGIFFIAGGRFIAGRQPDSMAADYIGKGYSGYGDKGVPKAEGYYDTSEGRKAELFFFDPNTADSTAFLRLGLSRRLIRNIYRYRAKGGTFRNPEDFAQLYGLTLGQYRRLEPYIRISDDFRPASEFIARKGYNVYGGRHQYPANVTAQDSMAHPVKIREGEYVSVNSADTTVLCRVPGIGSGFARRIYKYRQRLGGFTSKEQLHEIAGIPESSLPYFRVDAANIRKLRINHSTAEKLRSHPYIDYRQARDIMDYRRLKGDIHDAEDLRAVHTFTDNDLKKILPYIDFN